MSNVLLDENGCFILKGDYLNLDDCAYNGKTIFPRTKAGCIEGLKDYLLNAIKGLQKIIEVLDGEGVLIDTNEYANKVDYTVGVKLGPGLKFNGNNLIMLNVGSGFSFSGNTLNYNPIDATLSGYKID